MMKEQPIWPAGVSLKRAISQRERGRTLLRRFKVQKFNDIGIRRRFQRFQMFQWFHAFGRFEVQWFKVQRNSAPVKTFK
jgi:hypothetical protein